MIEVYFNTDNMVERPWGMWFVLDGATPDAVHVNLADLRAGFSIRKSDIREFFDLSPIEDVLEVLTKEELLQVYENVLKFVRDGGHSDA